jgi:PEP-CTERM motif-containing protein
MRTLAILSALLVISLYSVNAKADSIIVNTGTPDGKIATASQPASKGKGEVETADDFIIGAATSITGGTFTGLIPTGASVDGVTIEFYRVFPNDSTVPPGPSVPVRDNSPSDVEFSDRSSASANLNFSTTLLNSSFTASNSVGVNGIHPIPGVFTGGDGAVTGQEVLFSFSIDPDLLPADHYFFVPQVQLSNGDFSWLSAPKPIVAPGTLFAPDLQTWIRNDSIAPNWLRVGTDITHQGPFNAAFSLSGTVATPEPATLLLTGVGLLALLFLRRK